MRFGAKLNRLSPPLPDQKDASIVANPVAVESRWLPARFFPPSFMYCARAANGRHCLANSARPARFMPTFSAGKAAGSSSAYGKPD